LNDRQCGIKKDVAAPGADKSQKKTSACGTEKTVYSTRRMVGLLG
jgi:hypothetical protein